MLNCKARAAALLLVKRIQVWLGEGGVLETSERVLQNLQPGLYPYLDGNSTSSLKVPFSSF